MSKNGFILLLIFFECLFCDLFITKGFCQNKPLRIAIVDTGSERRIKLLKLQVFPPESQMHDTVIKLLQRAGYPSSVIVNTVQSKSGIKIYVRKGKPLLLTCLQYENKWKPLLEKTGIDLETVKTQPFDYDIFRSKLNEALVYLENNGYPFAKIIFDSITYPDNLISGRIDIVPGEKFYFDTISVISEVKINLKMLQKYMGISAGSVYNESRLNNIRYCLNRLPFIAGDYTLEINFRNHRAFPVFWLKPVKASRFSGIAGLVPDNSKPGKNMITGEISLLLYNSFKLAEKIEFEWHKTSKYSQDLDCRLGFPALYTLPFGLSLQYHLLKQDTSYIINYFETNIESFRQRFGFKGIYSFKGSVVTGSNHTELNWANYKLSQYGLGFEYRNVDQIYLPRKGFLIESTAKTGLKRYDYGSNFSDTAIRIQTRNEVFEGKIKMLAYYPIYRFIVMSFAFSSEAMFHRFFENEKNRFFTNEMYQTGGLKSIRGFDEKSLKATTYFISSAEVDYRFEQNSRLFVLFDYGYIESRSIKKLHYQHLFSTGAGMSFATRAGMFTLIYAIGSRGGNHWSLKDARIHFGYITVF